MLFSMSVTKPHFTAMVILLILADKTAGNSGLPQVWGSHMYNWCLSDL